MLRWEIDGKKMVAEIGQTVWEAAKQSGVEIPALCYKNGLPHYTSCMVCMVWDEGRNQAIPSCSTLIYQDMVISTQRKEVQEIRQTAIEFLLSEHLGECYAPCQKLCAGEMNIPLMLRQIQRLQFKQAIATIKKDIALPSILGRICPAPCEKGCRRKNTQGNEPVAIRNLKGFIGDWDLQQEKPYIPDCLPINGKRIAIVGAGPMGLSSAYYLVQYGFDCTIWDEHEDTGGMLRYGIVNDTRLEKDILVKEIANLFRIGNIHFQPNIQVGKDITWSANCWL